MADAKEPAAPAQVKPTTAAELSAAFPDLVSGIRAEATTAERERINGIENLGAQMKGHEKLLADMKADGSVTVEKAAVRIVEAENALRAGQLKGIADVETHTGKVAAAPAGAEAHHQPKVEQASTPEGWSAEYEAKTPEGETLRGEFASKEDYVAFKANAHKVRILRK